MMVCEYLFGKKSDTSHPTNEFSEDSKRVEFQMYVNQIISIPRILKIDSKDLALSMCDANKTNEYLNIGGMLYIPPIVRKSYLELASYFSGFSIWSHIVFTYSTCSSNRLIRCLSESINICLSFR